MFFVAHKDVKSGCKWVVRNLILTESDALVHARTFKRLA